MRKTMKNVSAAGERLKDARTLIEGMMPERVRSNRQPDSLILRYQDSIDTLKKKRRRITDEKEAEDIEFWLRLTYKKLLEAGEKYLNEEDHSPEDMERIRKLYETARQEMETSLSDK